MPQVNSEFYTGWLDHWGDQHAVVDAQKISRVLEEMLTIGANVNMYVPSPNPLRGFILYTNLFKGYGYHYHVFFLLSTNPMKIVKPAMH